ncbi:tetratricopeptide repeat protein [Stenotrophomonas indicatrix]|uniref:tetratricopeptide repeat protein n=1 Tax=Stenotrophomonas indicatrix TaxID=2045451 RepID=UPI00265717FA|nr:tetratricopeptide repeat protein [Stenotrophomonas indicatrix]MDN8646345.1 tetratricopeptide repeat protein [Stenotrophomonas indicatrix]MDN8657098.1 tetratricopeptide repeat protein [Stenotrophomonas indicatrix]
MQDQILQALRQNDAGQAVQLAQAWTRDEPGKAEAHRWLALALQQQGQAEAAMEALQQALQLAPDDAQLHLQQAGLLLALRQFDGADEALLRTTGLDPNAFPAYLMQAHLAVGRNDFDEAQRLSTLASRLEPDHPELLTIDGMVALRRGDADRALALLSAASQALPDDTRVLYALGFAYLGKDMLAFAEQAFRRVLALNPKMSSLHGMVVQLALRQGNVDAAAQAMQQALQQPELDVPPMRRLAGELALRSGQPLQALEHLLPLLESLQGDRQVLQLLLMSWQRLGREDEARTRLDDALESNDQLHDLWLARLAVEDVGSAGAVAVVERWMAAMPGHLPALEARMRLHDMAGEHEQGEAIAERITTLEPGRVSGESRRVEGLLQRDPAAAVERVQALIAQAPEGHRADLRTWLGEIQDRAGQPEEALRTWMALQTDRASQRLPLPPQAKAPPSWPEMASIDEATRDSGSAPIFLWGAPGSGVERVATGLAAASPVLRSDRYTATPPDDAFQNYNTLQDLASGVLSPERLVERWREHLPARGLESDTVIDWLLWWDNALLWALRPQLPQGRLLLVLRDPRDMLLDWIAYGAAAPLAMTSMAEASQWLVRSLTQIAALHEEDLYPHVLLRIDDIGNDAHAMADLLGRVFGRPMPPAAQLGAPRLPAGHWRRYRDVMGAAFAQLTPVAVRLGYPEE